MQEICAFCANPGTNGTTTLGTSGDVGMAKRFTDAAKWRNEWFRTLDAKAKLAWIYLCDECDKSGIIRIDYGLASFQLGYRVTSQMLASWFGYKIHFFGGDKILVVQYFEFQYGTSKDTWSAKVEAKKSLESQGFEVIDNKVFIPSDYQSDPTVVSQSPQSEPSSLIRVRGRVSNTLNRQNEKISESDLDQIYGKYPKKQGKTEGYKALTKSCNKSDLSQLDIAVTNYAQYCENKITEKQYIMKFKNFVKEWRDWIDCQAEAPPPTSDLSDIPWDKKPGGAA